MHLHGGGLASFAGGFIFLASAAGAPLAGWLVEQASYAALGIAAFAACMLTAVLMPSRLRGEAAQG
jgi:predicted MFS family arabinose efflux permease